VCCVGEGEGEKQLKVTMKDVRRQLRQQKASTRPLRRNPPRNASKDKKNYCELDVSDEEGPSVYRMLTDKKNHCELSVSRLTANKKVKTAVSLSIFYYY
jgi:hypothetical protein